jgi:hypothetical protein
MSLSVNQISFLIFALLLSACTQSSKPSEMVREPSPLQGNEGGNGGDKRLQQNLGAWFLTEVSEGESLFSKEDLSVRKINVCLRKAPHFGVSEEAARTMVEETVSVWQKYIKIQNIFFISSGKKFRPATKLHWVECSETPDLQIVLGITDDVMKEHMRHFVRPIGYAWQTEVNKKTGWGRGYIWVAPPFSQSTNFPRWGSGKELGFDSFAEQAQFRQILLHEFGHVMGCDHVAGTIMRADILAHIASDPSGEKWAKKYEEDYTYHNFPSGTIDGESKLLHSRICYGKAEDGSCLNSVVARVLAPDPEHSWPDPFVIKQLFGKVNLESISFNLGLLTRPDGTQYFDVRYLGRVGHDPSPIERNLRIEIIETPLFSENDPRLFLMNLKEKQFALRAAGNDILNGTVQIDDKIFPALIQLAPRNGSVIRLWILDGARRIRLN